jgi:hypothetical protein
MSNRRDIGALIAALLEARGHEPVEVFSWDLDPHPPWGQHPDPVGNVVIRMVEHDQQCTEIKVLTSDNKRFNILVYEE